MDVRLSSPITDISGIGPAKAKFLKKLNINHVRDLLYTFPRRYDDFSNVTTIDNLRVGEQMTVRGTIASVNSQYGFQGKRRLLRIFVNIQDDTGILHVTWYNLTFLIPQLKVGRAITVSGKVEASRHTEVPGAVAHAMRSPALEFYDDTTHTARIVPIYPETSGVTSRFIRYQVKRLLPIIQSLPEYMPEEIRKTYHLMPIREAIQQAHFPDSKEQQDAAWERLRFDELFFLQLAARVRRANIQKKQAHRLTISDRAFTAFVKQLPFSLTSAQQRVLAEIREDMEQPHPMNRLLQGDVGSGKSAVALLATRIALANKKKVLYIAPTEILARQQSASFARSLGDGVVHLLVGATKQQDRARILKLMKSKRACCIVGTHALLQDTITVKHFGLAIVDEQHRFGVDQRSALINRADTSHAKAPHLLSMTATPIPRTLSLTVYGDLNVSVLDEMPPGRKTVTTKIVPAHKREDAIVHVLEELHHGRQAYVIAPLVEESQKLAVASAEKTYIEMQKLLPGIAVGLVHGKMPTADKDAVMKNFSAGALQVLVSTVVVEVGVDVPNATIMIIEGAERFGLAQLHQLRGRIGRGEHASHCYLFPTAAESVHSERLRILENTTDGFEIAEKDLELRGPGEVYGTVQSGYGSLQVASLLDYKTIRASRTAAQQLLKQDPTLDRYPILQKKVEQKNLQTHFE